MPTDRALALAFGLLLAAGCGSDPPDPRAPVARINGTAVTLAEFQSYLDANLVPGEEEPSNLVKSRLFDAFVEERVLLAEAERVGTDVASLEAEAYRQAMERNPIEEAELQAYMDEHRQRLSDRRRVTLRSLPIGSVDEAAAARFDEEAGPPLTVEWQELDEELRAALEDLRPGEVSRPVEVHGEVYLFRIDSREGEGAAPDRLLLDRARAELRERRRSEAQRAWLAELLRRSAVELESGNLPFRYVPRPKR